MAGRLCLELDWIDGVRLDYPVEDSFGVLTHKFEHLSVVQDLQRLGQDGREQIAQNYGVLPSKGSIALLALDS